jgi:hypothetical protein
MAWNIFEREIFMRLASKSILMLVLTASVSMVLLVGCGGDDDGGNGGSGSNGGNGGGVDCTDHKYYCITTTFTPEGGEPEVSYEVIDLCGSDASPIDPQCVGEVDGSNVSFDCSYSQAIGECNTEWTFDVSGTITDQAIDLSGDGSLVVSGNCGPLTNMSFTYTGVGERVASADAPCGPVSDFNITATKPSGTVSLETTSLSIIYNVGGYTMTATLGDVAGGSINYSFTLIIPAVGSTPSAFDARCVGSAAQGEASFTYMEMDMAAPFPIWNLCPGAASGTVNITTATPQRIAGSFNISGTTSGTGGSESRTIAGDFDIPVDGGLNTVLSAETARAILANAIQQNSGTGVLAP